MQNHLERADTRRRLVVRIIQYPTISVQALLVAHSRQIMKDRFAYKNYQVLCLGFQTDLVVMIHLEVALD